MINFIGTDITKELLVVYTLIGIVIAFLVVFLIVDHVKNKKRENTFNSRKLTRSLKQLERETRKSDSIETTVIQDKKEEVIVPIEELKIDETVLEDIKDDDDIYIEEEIEKTQAQIEVEEITRALEEAQKEERVDPYKQFEEEQELNAIISYEELQEKFDKLYDENEKIQYVDDDNLPIDLDELYQKNEEILNPKKVKLDDLNTVKVEPEVKKETVKQSTTGFKSSPVISPVYGIQPEHNQNVTKTNVSDVDAEIKRTNDFLKTLKELQRNLD